jgi:hypothetical protein
MRASSWSLVWVAVLLESCPQVEVLSVVVDADSFPASVEDGRNVYVDAVVLRVHAGSVAGAARVAASLGLGEDPAGRHVSAHGLSWREWSGWCPEGSREAPVRVEVVSSEPVPDAVVAS